MKSPSVGIGFCLTKDEKNIILYRYIVRIVETFTRIFTGVLNSPGRVLPIIYIS